MKTSTKIVIGVGAGLLLFGRRSATPAAASNSTRAQQPPEVTAVNAIGDPIATMVQEADGSPELIPGLPEIFPLQGPPLPINGHPGIFVLNAPTVPAVSIPSPSKVVPLIPAPSKTVNVSLPTPSGAGATVQQTTRTTFPRISRLPL